MMVRRFSLWIVLGLLLAQITVPQKGFAQGTMPGGPNSIDVEVILRVYTPGREASGSWEGTIGRMSGSSIHIDTTTLPEDAILALAGWDQETAELRGYVGNTFIVYHPAPELPAPAVPWNGAVDEDFEKYRGREIGYHLFTAGTGDSPLEEWDILYVLHKDNRISDYMNLRRPMLEGARLLNLGSLKEATDSGNRIPRCIPASAYKLDAQGRLDLYDRISIQSRGAVIASHPDYGRAMVQFNDSFRTSGGIWLPLIRKDDAIAGLAISGTLLDSNRQPVPDGFICLEAVTTPDNRSIRVKPAYVMTDAQGCFRLFPHRQGGMEDGRFDLARRYEPEPELSPHSNFRIVAMASPDSELLPRKRSMLNGDSATITLSPGDDYHRFAMELDGETLTGQQLVGLRLSYVSDDEDLNYQQELPRWIVTDGGRVAHGRYHGSIFRDGTDTEVGFSIDAQSPELIVIRQRPSIEYSGRIVDVRTGQPYLGAVVGIIGIGNHHASLDGITDEEWTAIEQMPTGVPIDPEQTAIARCFKLVSMTRTDAMGRYTLKTDPAQPGGNLLVAARDYLAMSQSPRMSERDNPVTELKIPDIGILPSAYVTLQLNDPVTSSTDFRYSNLVRGGNSERGFRVSWKIDHNQSPGWTKGLDSFHFVRDEFFGERRFNHYDRRKIGESVRIAVPADSPLQLIIHPSSDSSPKFILPQAIRLVQGETLDLGSVEAPETIPFLVQLVDTDGLPLVGLSVRLLGVENVYHLPEITDRNGVVEFSATESYKGNLRLETYYNIGGKAVDISSKTEPWEIDMEAWIAAGEQLMVFTVNDEYLKEYRQIMGRP